MLGELEILVHAQIQRKQEELSSIKIDHNISRAEHERFTSKFLKVTWIESNLNKHGRHNYKNIMVTATKMRTVMTKAKWTCSISLCPATTK